MTTQFSLGIGTGYTQLPAQQARRVIVSNPSQRTVLVRQDGAGEGFPVPAGQVVTFRGLEDAAQLEVMCEEAMVTVYFRTEY